MKKTVLEIDQLIVPLGALWQARAGMAPAKRTLAAHCAGKELKSGIYDISDDEGVVGLVELSKLGVVKTLVIKE